MSAYQLNTDEKILISRPEKRDNDNNGLRLKYIFKGKNVFECEPMGESYIYKPTFYKFSGDTVLIVCEYAFEYSTGIDVYELSTNMMRKLGSLNLATDEDDGKSIIPNINRYEFTFNGKVIVNPGMTAENRIDGKKLIVRFNEHTGKTSLMIMQ